MLTEKREVAPPRSRRDDLKDTGESSNVDSNYTPDQAVSALRERDIDLRARAIVTIAFNGLLGGTA